MKTKKRTIVVAIAVSITVLTIAVGIILSLNQHKKEKIQEELVAELIAKAGSYDDSIIILNNTNKYEAAAMAKKLDAKLRITSNGHFAALYLPDGKTILDVCTDKANLKYISAITPDYNARISDLANDEESDLKGLHLPTPANYPVGDTFYLNQTYLNYINIGETWKYYKGQERTIAIIDTGIDTDHPEFSGRISEYSYNASTDQVVKDYMDDSGNYDWDLIEDEMGHGTLVAGVIAAAMNGEGITGIAPEATIIVIKAECDATGTFLRTSDLVFGLYYAIECDADVVNMSFGSSLNAFADAAQLAYDSDIICVAAAGNDGVAAPQYPASDPNVVGVGALADNSWERANYSNYGDNVEVYAPGTTFTTAIGGKYTVANGTSLASPIVAAAAVLYKTSYGPYYTNDVFKERLHASCYDLGVVGPDFYYGYGALDVNELVNGVAGRVTFEMLTDEVDNESVLFIHNHAVQDIPEPERLYAVFDGWYYDPQFTEELNWYEDIYSMDTILYAKWANEDDAIPFEYRILEDDTIEITGYKGKRRFITVPNYIESRQVSSIGDNAFAYNNRLRRVILPRYLKSIGNSAFRGCTGITAIELPIGVKTIGDNAFDACTSLETISVGSSVETIGDFAFSSCVKLTSLYFPATLKTIDGTAFLGDVSLLQIMVEKSNQNFVSVDGALYNKSKSTIVAYPAALTAMYTIPNETTIIGRCAFAFSSSSYVDLGSIEQIKAGAFSSSRITSVNIPDSCLKIEESAFAGCSSLSSVLIGRSITEIGEAVFACDEILNEITIPRQIGLIDKGAFSDSALERVSFEEGSLLYAIAENAFSGTRLFSIELPDSLLSIREGAFCRCSNLETVIFTENSSLRSIGKSAFESTPSLKSFIFPATVVSVDKYCFRNSGLSGTVIIPANLRGYGEGMFAACYNLTDILVEEGNANYVDVDGVVYNTNQTVLIEYPAGNLRTSYQTLNSTEVIGDYSFYGSRNLNYITISENVTDINPYAFYDCKYVYYYYLNENLINIGEYAFSENTSLSYIRIPKETRLISRCSFANDYNLTSIDLSDDTEMARIGVRAFAFTGLQTFRVPANITSIAQYAFEGCSSLRSVTFAENSKLEHISAYFFNGCENISTIVFEQGSALKSIQAHGLQGLTNLCTIDFGNAQIENIDNYAFRNCSSLRDLVIPSTVKNIGRFAFYKCTSLNSLTVPQTLEHIGEYAFYATNNLELYFTYELLPIFLDENWDNGLAGYYTGVVNTIYSGDWKYAVLNNGSVALLEYLGDDDIIDLNNFEFGDISVIGGYAFADKPVKSILLPDTLEQIQRYAFLNTRISSIVIPENVIFIAQHAFDHSDIGSVVFEGNNIKVIEQYAFANTKQLQNVTIPGSLEKLGSYAFYSSGISSVSFGEGFNLSILPEGIFAKTNIASVTIPDCVTKLDNNAFSHNYALKSVDLGAGNDLMIMSNVFYNTGLTNVYIGANVSFIGEYSFMDLNDLVSFTVDDNNPFYTAVDGVLYNKDRTKLISMPAGRTGVYTIPKEVEILGFGAFENSKLSEILVENGSALVTMGYRVFYNAQNLTAFEIPEGVVSIDYYAFAECDHLETVTFAEGNKLSGIYEGAFFGCRNLKNILLPDTVAEISEFAFYGCEQLDILPLGSTSEVIGIYDNAFAYTSISDMILPKGLLDIGKYAFRNTQVQNLIINNDNPNFNIEFGAFADNDNLESIQIPVVYGGYLGYIFGATGVSNQNEYVSDNLKNIIVSNQTVFDAQCFKGLDSIETVRVSDDTLYLGEKIFFGCSSLKRIDIPDQIDYIRDESFSGCSGLENVKLPLNLKSIGKSAFYECSKMQIEDFPNKIDEIGENAFCRCESLEYAILPETISVVGKGAFQYCYSLKEARIGGNTVEENVFDSCSNLEKVTIGDNITAIKGRAFVGCNKLKYVIGGGNASIIGQDAFNGCSELCQFDLSPDVVSIGSKAFIGCSSLKIEIVLNKNLSLISDYAFDSSGITSLIINGTIESFGANIFRFCENLEYVEINGNITTIPDSFLTGCKKLRTLIVPETLENISASSLGGCSSLTDIYLPESVKKIYERAFSDCTSLRKIVIPYNVEYIGDDAFVGCNIWDVTNYSSRPIELGSSTEGKVALNAFLLLDNGGKHYASDNGEIIETGDGFVFEKQNESEYILKGYFGSESAITLPSEGFGYPYTVSLIAPDVTEINIPEGIIDISLAENSKLEKLNIPSTVSNLNENKIKGCNRLKEITVSNLNEHISCENGVLSCDGVAFYFTTDAVPDVVIPEGVKCFADWAFEDRTDIISITFPESFEATGGRDLFYHCKIEKMYFNENSSVRLDGSFFHGGWNIKELVLGGCTYIGQSFFRGCKIESLTIPGSVEVIDSEAFCNCQNLNELIIENGVKTIKNRAFADCPKLKSVFIPASVEEIEPSAFNMVETVYLDEDNSSFVLVNGMLFTADMSRLVWVSTVNTHLSLPSGITSIPDGMFKNCEFLETVVIPEGVTEIGRNAFSGCINLSEVVLPEGLTVIKQEAFANCSKLDHIDLPDSLLQIWGSVFENCSNLTEISLPDNLESIGSRAFASTGIDTIYIPASVNSIDCPFFRWDYVNIKSIEIDPANEYYYVFNGILCSTELAPNPNSVILTSAAIGNDLIIPEGVERIPFDMLSGFSFDSITLPESLIAIESNIGVSSNCKRLFIPKNVSYINNGYYYANVYAIANVEIVVDPDNEYFSSINGALYDKQGTTLLFAPSLSGVNDEELTTLVIPEGTTEIGRYEFDSHYYVTEVVLPSTLQVINEGAFRFDGGFRSITIPPLVNTIGVDAFAGTYIKVIYNESDLVFVPGTTDYGRIAENAIVVYNKGVATLGEGYYESDGFVYCEDGARYKIIAYIGDESEIMVPRQINNVDAFPDNFFSLSVKTIRFEEGTTTIPNYAFCGNTSMENVEIPDSVTDIGYMAFARSPSLKKVIMTGGMYSLGWYQFSECTALSEVVFHSGLVEIGGHAFWGDTALKNVIWPDTLKRIRDGAFSGCALSSALPYGLEEIGDQAFAGANIIDLVIPDSVKTIGSGAFSGSQLSNVVIPDSVTAIGDYAFNTTNLLSIVIPDSVTSIGASAFAYCNMLENIVLPEKTLVIGAGAFKETAFEANESNWEADFLYCGNHLLEYRGNEKNVCMPKDAYSICMDAFMGNTETICLEVSGDTIGAFGHDYLPNLQILIIRTAPNHNIYECFGGYVPLTIKGIVLKKECVVDSKTMFANVDNISIFVEAAKEDAPFDRIVPGWNNGNSVSYGNDWYMVQFFDANGDLISVGCFKCSEAIRPPYVVLPRSGDTTYTHIGWDLDGDGEPDGLPATNLGFVTAYAVVETSQPAVYTVKFIDMDRVTVLYQYLLEYGNVISLPEDPEKPGYIFTGWDNYSEGDTVYRNTRIYSTWKHQGNGHDYEKSFVEPTCTEKGYILHRCIICGDEYRTDYVDELWHDFDEWIIDDEATCSENGVKHRICHICGFTEEAIVSTTGHSYVGTVEKEPTCTEYGIMHYECSVCGDIMSEAIELKPHNYHATHADKEYIDWLSNLYSGIVYGFEGDDYWYYTCSECGKIKTLGDTSASSIGSHRHQYSELTNDAGNQIGIRCDLCGEIIYRTYTIRFVNEDGTTLDTQTVPYGTTPVYNEDIPVKEASDGYFYTFIGWEPEIKEATASITYYAQFSRTKIGDINGDDEVTDEDAIYLLFYTFFPEDYPLNQEGDFNGDGEVTDEDAIYLLFYTFFPEDYPIG